MTKLLERAIEQARSLDADEQDSLAALMLQEIESEAAWDERLTASHERLSMLAAEARREIADGHVSEEDPGDHA